MLSNQDVLLCSYEFRDILIQGLQVTIAPEIDTILLLSWVDCMRDERSLRILWLQKKRQSPQAQILAVFVALRDW